MASLQEFANPSVPFTGDTEGRHKDPNIGDTFPICCPIHPTEAKEVTFEELQQQPDALNKYHCRYTLPLGPSGTARPLLEVSSPV